MIKKIIVEMADAEATFSEFDSITSFLESDLYKVETATVVETVDVSVTPSEPTVEVAPEAVVSPTE